MLRQRVITALMLAGAFIATLLFAPFAVQCVLFAAVASAGAWEWSALSGARSTPAKLAYTVVIPLLCWGLWIILEMDAARLPRSTTAPRYFSTIVVRHVFGTVVLPRWPLCVESGLDSSTDGVDHAFGDLAGRIDLSDVAQRPRGTLPADTDGRNRRYRGLLCRSAFWPTPIGCGYQPGEDLGGFLGRPALCDGIGDIGMAQPASVAITSGMGVAAGLGPARPVRLWWEISRLAC